MKQFIYRHRYIIAAAIALALLIIVITASLLTGNQSGTANNNTNQNSANDNSQSSSDNDINYGETNTSSNQETSSVSNVANLRSTVRNLPDSEFNNIYTQLNNTLAANQVTGNTADAVVRDGSYSQTISDQSKMIYYTTFIIDLPSIKQSYVVQDWWSPLPVETTKLTDYTTLVLCPDASQLKYGEFTCTDRIKQERGQ